MTGFDFQSLKPQDSLSNELRSVIRDNVLQFYTKGLSTEAEEEGLTALYERLSQEDKLDGIQLIFLRNALIQSGQTFFLCFRR